MIILSCPFSKHRNQNKEIKESFVDCLLRIKENVKTEMNALGLEVHKVTIGKGCNDVMSILNDKFVLEAHPVSLGYYNGYSYAQNQYEIENKTHIRNR